MLCGLGGLVVGVVLGWFTHNKARTWCPGCGISLVCPACQVPATTGRPSGPGLD